MSTFDPELFMSQTTEGEMSTHSTPIPEGDFIATVDDAKPREIETKDGARVVLDVTLELVGRDGGQPIDDLKADLGRQKITVRDSLFLDIDASGAISTAKGQNVRLGRLREAVGQNTGGVWSPTMLKGAGPVVVRVTQRPDKDDPETVYNGFGKIAPVAPGIPA